MKVRVVGKEMSLGLQIPDGMEYEFMLKVIQTGRSMSRGGTMVENFKDFLQKRAFVETDDTLKFPEESEEASKEEILEEEPAEEESEDYGRYKGFLHLKCSHCGEIKSFCTKKPITGYFCKSCKKLTDLEDLKPLYLYCPCGGRHRYLTNREESMFDMECPECGNPVAVEYNSKRKVYQTIQEDE